MAGLKDALKWYNQWELPRPGWPAEFRLSGRGTASENTYRNTGPEALEEVPTGEDEGLVVQILDSRATRKDYVRQMGENRYEMTVYPLERGG